ncbi:SDR family oxidoreductase [Mucilaginibacter sp. L3T2-6]|uniref:SDR family oxidoreductase n=1 Tax=Mucilaginibacter sp. L3T2-6 TaxID=3062491 RepID=UPI0026765865|nr:SDR family oxidoreductase [Mucilaginibacter sp. L3T2-6]MDO3642231.1 SDR family oxidoreductase [Mucilaginibacter sp. L3T2-6]MDV6214726.1 SDR family oxidoreductase [Mucilaginibacter sp. L3T2-6]
MYDNRYHEADLSRYSFLITGGAGFIGSNLVKYLLKYNAGKVRVLDNFLTGYRRNVEPFLDNPAFEMMEGDIRDIEVCKKAVIGMDYISHQAALGSVPRSINDPVTTNSVNISGFLNVIHAVKDSGTIKRFIYAASSSTYGSSQELPKVEARIGKPLSPYAVTKYVNELYADLFSRVYGLESVGLRYFNIFGPGQSPESEYAAAIPKFILAAKLGKAPTFNGDGEQTRDFTFVENAVQANIKSFFIQNVPPEDSIYNIACGSQTSLNQLWLEITRVLDVKLEPVYRESRAGDVRHSLANIEKAGDILGYKPLIGFKEGIKTTIESFNYHQCFY